MIKTILSGHYSPETAYLVNDYPWGFRLRCKKRYWLEFRKGMGFRLCTQTENPKTLVWCAPKYSTYSLLGMVLYLDENNHVQSFAIGVYESSGQCEDFLNAYWQTMPSDAVEILKAWIARKKIVEEKFAKNELKFEIKATAPVQIV